MLSFSKEENGFGEPCNPSFLLTLLLSGSNDGSSFPSSQSLWGPLGTGRYNDQYVSKAVIHGHFCRLYTLSPEPEGTHRSS